MASDLTTRLGGARSSLAFKAPCRVATTANIALTGTQTIDGVAVIAEDRVLVKDQTDASENGVYICKATSWQRARDFDGTDDVVKGTRVYVHSGSVGAGSYVVTTADEIEIGTSDIAFELTITEADVSAFARTLLDDASAAAARSTLDAIEDVTTTRGDMIRRGASAVERVGIGTSGYALISDGTDPAWTGFAQQFASVITRTWRDKARDTVDIRDYTTVTDGTTDVRTALQAALDEIPRGWTLELGPYTYAVSKGSGDYCLTRSEPIRIKGRQNTAIKPLASGITSDTHTLYLNGSSHGVYLQTIIEDVFFGNNGGATREGGHAIVFDTQVAGAYFGRPHILRCYLQQSANSGKYGLFHVNSAVNNVNGGLYGATIEKSYIAGISLNDSGDSIWIRNNLLAGAQAGVYGKLITNAGNLVIAENNITAAAGAIVLDRAVTYEIVNNEIEQLVTNTNANGTIIDLRGSTATLGPGRITGNMIQDIASVGNPTLIRVGDASGTVIDNNRLGTSTVRTGVDITASAANTVWGAGNTLSSATLSDSGTNTIYMPSSKGTATSLVGNSTGSKAAPHDIALGAQLSLAAGPTLNVSGDWASAVAGTAPIRLKNTNDSASVTFLKLEGDRATPATNDVAYTEFYMSDNAGSQVLVAREGVWMSSVVAGATSSQIRWGVITAGSLANVMVLVGTVLAPLTNDGLALGTTSLSWSDLFLASGGVINFNNGDVTITHSSDALTLAGGKLIPAATSTSFASMNLPTGSAPSSPVDGDIWREDNTNTGFKIRVNGVTKTITLS